MGLILNDKLQAMIAGFPTVSDKYNVSGGINESSTAMHFGDLVQKGATPGYFKPATSVSAVGDICGFILGTNVKLAEGFGTNVVQVNQGEAFNLMIDGFIAVALDSGATSTYVTANAPVYVILATGKCTTSDKASAGTIVQLPNCVFTGFYETQGSVIVAEVCVK